MSEYCTTEDLMDPIEALEITLAVIEFLYNNEQIKDRENAELLIESHKRAIELLSKEEVE